MQARCGRLEWGIKIYSREACRIGCPLLFYYLKPNKTTLCFQQRAADKNIETIQPRLKWEKKERVRSSEKLSFKTNVLCGKFVFAFYNIDKIN